MRLAVEKLRDANIQRESQPLNIVQRDAVLCILDLADLVLGKFGGVRQILLAHIPRKPRAAHVLRQDASRCMNVPPCHLHGRPPDSKIDYGTFSIKKMASPDIWLWNKFHRTAASTARLPRKDRPIRSEGNSAFVTTRRGYQ
jgi:hypothetical protein